MSELWPGLRLRGVDGRSLSPRELVVVECIKGSAARPRWAYRVSDGGRELLLKIRRLRTARHRIQATAGRAYLDNEYAMLRVAAAAGLPVPEPVGRGGRRTLGVVCDQALLTRWLDERQPLTALITKATAEHDEAAVELARLTLGALLGAARRAGLADKDFGDHNVLVRTAGELAPVWGDLERAYRVGPGDAKATAECVAGALARWWLATRGDQRSLERTLPALIAAAPVKGDECSAVIAMVQDMLQARVKRMVGRGLIDRSPEALKLL